MATFEFHNISDMERAIKSLSGELRSRAEDAISDEADAIVITAKNEYSPVLSGKLRDSIQKVKSTVSQGRDIGGRFTSGSDIEISIIAGGDDIPYAAAVHETPSVHDPPSWEGKTVNFKTGGSKFLELPIRQAEKGMAGRIAAKLKL